MGLKNIRLFIARQFFSRGFLLSFVVVWVGSIFIGSLFTLNMGGQGEPDTTWERVQENDVLIVGVDVNFPPFAFYNPTNGQVEGIDVDLARIIADELGVEVQLVGVGVDSRYDMLFLGQVDILIAAIRPEPVREGFVRYTDAYFDGGFVFVRRQNSPTIEIFNDFWTGTDILAVEIASEGDTLARDYLDENPHTFTLKRTISTERVLSAVLNGEADYGLVNGISARRFAHEHSEIQISKNPMTHDFYVIALRRTEWRLYREIQQILDRLQDHGQLQTIIERWL
jgi:ABC-type amino acid transport substrate-binding protein